MATLPASDAQRSIILYKDISGSASANTVTVKQRGDGALEFTDRAGVTKRVRDEEAKELFKTLNAISS